MRSVFVLSPYFCLESLVEAMAFSSRAVVVSTCLLLPSETRRIKEVDPEVAIHLLHDFFDDAALTANDEKVLNTIRQTGADSGCPELIRLQHVALYASGVRFYRNLSAATSLREKIGHVDKLFVCPGPNVDLHAWCRIFPEAGFSQLPMITNQCDPSSTPSAIESLVLVTGNGPLYAAPSLSGLRRTKLYHQQSSLCSILDLSVLEKDVSLRRFRFVVRLHRLLRPLAKVWIWQIRLRWYRKRKSLECDTWRHVFGQLMGWETLLSIAHQLVLLREARNHGARALMSGMHSFRRDQALAARFLNIPSFVLQDGYLPINYPCSVYDVYHGCSFVWWSPESQCWGQSIGLDGVVSTPRILPTQTGSVGCSREANPSSCGRVLVLLGHGGEWTSLIFRSDIDVFLCGIIEAARVLPDIEFRLRAHPTMVLESHDGVNSLDRLQKMVTENNVGNCTFSGGALSEDFDWATFAVSEYSLALMEFAACNLGGVAVFNPTRRRNFFEEFTARGVPYAATVVELVDILRHRTTEGRQPLLYTLSLPSIGLDWALQQLEQRSENAIVSRS